MSIIRHNTERRSQLLLYCINGGFSSSYRYSIGGFINSIENSNAIRSGPRDPNSALQRQHFRSPSIKKNHQKIGKKGFENLSDQRPRNETRQRKTNLPEFCWFRRRERR
ncbi:hypothetical protein V6Z11_D05G327000 [Gossypium hirsutum]